MCGHFLVMRKTADSASGLTHYEVKLKLEKLKGEVTNAERGAGYIYANNADFLEPIKKALGKIQENQQAILELIKTTRLRFNG